MDKDYDKAEKQLKTKYNQASAILPKDHN
jgi:hypothetical protein